MFETDLGGATGAWGGGAFAAARARTSIGSRLPRGGTVAILLLIGHAAPHSGQLTHRLRKVLLHARTDTQQPVYNNNIIIVRRRRAMSADRIWGAEMVWLCSDASAHSLLQFHSFCLSKVYKNCNIRKYDAPTNNVFSYFPVFVSLIYIDLLSSSGILLHSVVQTMCRNLNLF